MIISSEGIVVAQVVTTENVTRLIIDDLLCAALEGGITYWASAAYPVDGCYPYGATFVSECLSRGKSIIIEENDNFDYESPIIHTLTLGAFINGIQEFMNLRRVSLHELYENHDESDADIIVQLALFGDVIYG